MEPALHEKRPLQAERGDQEVEAHAAVAVAFQKGHEETKSNKDHHMDVLETCRKHTPGCYVTAYSKQDNAVSKK